MTALSITAARTMLYRLVANLQGGGAPITITGKKGNAVLVSEDDWNAITETLYLASIPGMADSIKEGLEECNDTIDL